MLIPFSCPFRLLIYGNSNCGKSFLIAKLIETQKESFERVADKILYFCKFQSSIKESIKKLVEFRSDLPTESDWENKNGSHLLIVLDDCQFTAFKSPEVANMFSQCRHRNVSVIISTQNAFPKDKMARDIQLNCNFLILMKSIRDLTPIRILSYQLYPLQSNKLISIYYKFTQKPYSYLLVDLNVTTNDFLRIRGNIWDVGMDIFLSESDVQQLNTTSSHHDQIGEIQTSSICL